MEIHYKLECGHSHTTTIDDYLFFKDIPGTLELLSSYGRIPRRGYAECLSCNEIRLVTDVYPQRIDFGHFPAIGGEYEVYYDFKYGFNWKGVIYDKDGVSHRYSGKGKFTSYDRVHRDALKFFEEHRSDTMKGEKKDEGKEQA